MRQAVGSWLVIAFAQLVAAGVAFSLGSGAFIAGYLALAAGAVRTWRRAADRPMWLWALCIGTLGAPLTGAALGSALELAQTPVVQAPGFDALCRTAIPWVESPRVELDSEGPRWKLAPDALVHLEIHAQPLRPMSGEVGSCSPRSVWLVWEGQEPPEALSGLRRAVGPFDLRQALRDKADAEGVVAQDLVLYQHADRPEAIASEELAEAVVWAISLHLAAWLGLIGLWGLRRRRASREGP